MAFERLRQQNEADEIAKQQREKAVADAARAAQLQKEQAGRLAAQAEQRRQTALQAEQDRIEAERQKALAFREKSGVVKKLEEFTTLVKGVTLHPGSEDHTRSSVVDRLQWGKRLVDTQRLPDERENSSISYSNDYYVHHPRIETFEERYLAVETFPDGKIEIRGHERSTFMGFGNKGTNFTLEESDWTNDRGRPQSVVFEEPIWAAYNNPMTMRYSLREQTITYVPGYIGSD